MWIISLIFFIYTLVLAQDKELQIRLPKDNGNSCADIYDGKDTKSSEKCNLVPDEVVKCSIYKPEFNKPTISYHPETTASVTCPVLSKTEIITTTVTSEITNSNLFCPTYIITKTITDAQTKTASGEIETIGVSCPTLFATKTVTETISDVKVETVKEIVSGEITTVSVSCPTSLTPETVTETISGLKITLLETVTSTKSETITNEVTRIVFNNNTETIFDEITVTVTETEKQTITDIQTIFNEITNAITDTITTTVTERSTDTVTEIITVTESYVPPKLCEEEQGYCNGNTMVKCVGGRYVEIPCGLSSCESLYDEVFCVRMG
ncbi:hypothetical protein BB559_004573 [Furculomyces boomerangus]|uniref:Carbohydrate-binding module family 19 domain-containing protein n=2 Tax=Harpellales TaxID=61421 RepID=A0A2T9YDY9_9FUNG|nr:hypothetical protein BB559_004573 [Furculomyces boomerangus]PVZ96679.1 hypothetical protein BB558_007399 [Smittium angustum]